MQSIAASNLDGLPIEAHWAQRRCTAGHSFDMVREGYCNLLVVQHKTSRDPDDNKDMVAARRRFLKTGHFNRIADQMCGLETGGNDTACASPAAGWAKCAGQSSAPCP
jgi:hypothetical protein